MEAGERPSQPADEPNEPRLPPTAGEQFEDLFLFDRKRFVLYTLRFVRGILSLLAKGKVSCPGPWQQGTG